jgi:choice-of-anchor A domain-containing protein
MQNRGLLLLTLALTASPLVCKADPFGVASGFSLVALGTTGTNALAGNIHDGAEVTGRVAAAGEIYSIGTIGSALTNTGQFPDPFAKDATVGGVTYDLIAGGGLGTNVNINSDGSAYVNPTNGHTINFNGNGSHKGTLNPNGTATDPIDFNTLRTSLQEESQFLATSPTTGAPIPGKQNVPTILNATDPTLDVFTVTAQEFASGAIDVETHGGNPTVIINVTGSSNGTYTSGGIFLYNGQQDFSSEKTNKVLFNFPDASTLNLNGGEFAASVLAPYANLTAGTLDGTIIVGQVASLNGEVHNIEFDGTLPSPPPVKQSTPPVPEPGTLMLVGTGLLSVAGALRRKSARS